MTIAYSFGPKRLHIGISHNYVAMARGETERAPFAFRILVPSLVGALPLPPEQGFFVMTYVSTLGLLLAMYALLRRCGVSPAAAGLTVMLLCFSYPVAYYLGIWGLVDPLPHLLAVVAMHCVTRGWLLAATVVIFVASLAKETALLLVPLLGVEAFRRSGSVITAAFLALVPIAGYVLVRHSIAFVPGPYDIASIRDLERHIAREVLSNVREHGWPARIVREVLRSYSFFWILAILGWKHARALKAHTVYLVACGFALCVVANDWSRMLGYGFIGIFLLVGYYLDTIPRRHFWPSAAAFIGLAILQGYLALLGYHRLSVQAQIALVAGSVLVFAAGGTLGVILKFRLAGHPRQLAQ
jgi:hypothetical protein